MREARRAGTRLARSAAPPRSKAPPASANGSTGLTPMSIDVNSRVAATKWSLVGYSDDSPKLPTSFNGRIAVAVEPARD